MPRIPPAPAPDSSRACHAPRRRRATPFGRGALLRPTEWDAPSCRRGRAASYRTPARWCPRAVPPARWCRAVSRVWQAVAPPAPPAVQTRARTISSTPILLTALRFVDHLLEPRVLGRIEQLEDFRARRESNRIQLRTHRYQRRLEVAVTLVENAVDGRALRRRERQAIRENVDVPTACGTTRPVDQTVHRKAHRAADDQDRDEGGKGERFRALHGRLRSG